MFKSILSPLERLLVARVVVLRQFDGATTSRHSPCWESTYKTNRDGYAVIGADQSIIYAHRISYERWVGPLEKGKQIDHLCRNRACWNPDHLELVTAKENLARGMSPGAKATRSNMCKHGHSLEDAYINKKTGYRSCRVCFNAGSLRRYHRLKAERLAREAEEQRRRDEP